MRFTYQLLLTIAIASFLTIVFTHENEQFIVIRPSSRTFKPNLYTPIQAIYPPYVAEQNYPTYFTNEDTYNWW